MGAIQSIPLPLHADADGSLRVGDSRVLFETVIAAYEAGDGVEEVVHNFPTLKLADVHAVMAYYLTHRAESDAYLATRRGLADQARVEWTRRSPPNGFRAKLEARRDVAGGKAP